MVNLRKVRGERALALIHRAPDFERPRAQGNEHRLTRGVSSKGSPAAIRGEEHFLMKDRRCAKVL